MKILYIHQYFSTPKTSGGIRSYKLAKKLLENGHEVEFLTTSDGFSEKFEKRWNYVEIEGIRFHVLRTKRASNSTPYLKRIGLFLQFSFLASMKILKLEADVVLASSTPLTVGIPALVKKWRHKKPFVFEVRDVWPEAVVAIGAVKNGMAKKLLYGLEALIYRNANALVPLSMDMETSITNRFPGLDCPVKTIENIAEPGWFKRNIDPEKSIITEKLGFKPRFAILYAGTFGKVNGLGYALALAERLLPIDPSIVFILIGAGGERETLVQRAKQKNILDRNVFIWDPVAKNQLPQLYYEAQMGSSFVIPIKELWANSANKFFDTLAAGRPVLLNYEGWQKKALIKNNVGFVLPYDPEHIDLTFLNNFVAYTRDKVKLQLQQKNAIGLAEQFSLETATRKYLKILNGAMNHE